MILDIINAGVGLVLGVLSGFYFERRSSRSTREQNVELQGELEALRTSVYSVGGSPADEPTRAVLTDGSLLDAVLMRARATQDPQGRLSRTQLASYFFARGHRLDEIETAMDELCARGSAVDAGRWLQMR